MARRRGELFQVNRVVGEKELQLVERSTCAVPVCAQPVKKVIDVMVELLNPIDDLFTNKAVKEGVFQVQILYVSTDDYVRHAYLKIPFIADADIPGACSGMKVHNQVLRIEKSVIIVTEKTDDGKYAEVFDVKIAAKILFSVMETVERKLESNRPPQGQRFHTTGCHGEFRNQFHRERILKK